MKIGDRVKTSNGWIGTIAKIHTRKPHEPTPITVMVDKRIIISEAHQDLWNMAMCEPITNRLYQNKTTGEIISVSPKYFKRYLEKTGAWELNKYQDGLE